MKSCPYCNGNNVTKNGILKSGNQKYYCKDCKRSYSDNTRIVVKDEKCPYCGHKIRGAGKNTSGTQRYYCNNCHKKSSGPLTRKKFTNKEKLVKCPLCGAYEIIKRGIDKHGNQRYQCKQCQKYFTKDTIIRKKLELQCPKCNSTHIYRSGHNKNGTNRYKCADCSHKFTIDKKQKPFELQEKTCPICGHPHAKKCGKSGDGKIQYYKCLNCNHKFRQDGLTQLTPKQIKYIQQKYIDGVCKKDLAHEMRVCVKTIYNVTKTVITKAQQVRNYIIDKVLKGESTKVISKEVGIPCKTIASLMSTYYNKEKISEQQKQLIVKFGVGCSVPIEYIAKYVPCSENMCRKILKDYEIPQKKQYVISEKEHHQDIMALDRFMASDSAYKLK